MLILQQKGIIRNLNAVYNSDELKNISYDIMQAKDLFVEYEYKINNLLWNRADRSSYISDGDCVAWEHYTVEADEKDRIQSRKKIYSLLEKIYS
jgi:hypothetical protein